MGLEDSGHKVVLMGLMGAGKTTVGRGLAARLGWPFHDSDDDLARVTGFTARQLVARDGAEALHFMEAAVLLRRLAQPGDSVIAAAASTVEHAACRRALSGPSVMACWLRVGPATLARRFEAGVHRPRYGPDRLRSMADGDPKGNAPAVLPAAHRGRGDGAHDRHGGDPGRRGQG